MTEDLGLAEGDVEELQRQLANNRKGHPQNHGRPRISEDHPVRIAALEHLAAKLFASTGDELYIKAGYLGEKIDASAKEVMVVFRAIRDGEVDGLDAEEWGSTQRCSTWRVWTTGDDDE